MLTSGDHPPVLSSAFRKFFQRRRHCREMYEQVQTMLRLAWTVAALNNRAQQDLLLPLVRV